MNEGMDRTPLTRDFSDRPVVDVAPVPPGRSLARITDEGLIGPKLTGVGAYAGEIHPGFRAFPGGTACSSVTSGPPGHSYVYVTSGTSRRAS
ncbi:DNA-3-methyladenine glycosylase [Streptomyces sp. NPDC020403]|uniref:DNA-3-methyladenine glycosylase n=1 Tax=unclassified Streptomyces TaxID=2593676 RepID=UPI0033FBC5BD